VQKFRFPKDSAFILKPLQKEKGNCSAVSLEINFKAKSIRGLSFFKEKL